LLNEKEESSEADNIEFSLNSSLQKNKNQLNVKNSLIGFAKSNIEFTCNQNQNERDLNQNINKNSRKKLTISYPDFVNIYISGSNKSNSLNKHDDKNTESVQIFPLITPSFKLHNVEDKNCEKPFQINGYLGNKNKLQNLHPYNSLNSNLNKIELNTNTNFLSDNQNPELFKKYQIQSRM